MSNIWLFDIWPSIVTLTLSWHKGNMGFAHPLDEVNIEAKFEENPLIGIGNYRADTIMEKDGPIDGRTRQSESIIAPTFCGGVIKQEGQEGPGTLTWDMRFVRIPFLSRRGLNLKAKA